MQCTKVDSLESGKVKELVMQSGTFKQPPDLVANFSGRCSVDVENTDYD